MTRDDAVRQWAREEHVPDREQVAEVLDLYFGTSEVHVIDKLDALLRVVLADREARRREEQAFRANGRRYQGQAWKELVSRHDSLPSPVELAIWLAIVNPGFPRPRPFCPPALVGAWTRGGSRWTFAADGAFTTQEDSLAEYARWCVHLVENNADLRREQLWLSSDTAQAILMISTVSKDALDLLRAGGHHPNIEYHLQRTGAP